MIMRELSTQMSALVLSWVCFMRLLVSAMCSQTNYGPPKLASHYRLRTSCYDDFGAVEKTRSDLSLALQQKLRRCIYLKVEFRAAEFPTCVSRECLFVH